MSTVNKTHLKNVETSFNESMDVYVPWQVKRANAMHLSDAALSDDVDEVRKLIQEGADPGLAMLLCHELHCCEEGLDLIDRIFWELFYEKSLPTQLKRSATENLAKKS